eukprot:5380795-Amphidinium_carterae.1
MTEGTYGLTAYVDAAGAERAGAAFAGSLEQFDAVATIVNRHTLSGGPVLQAIALAGRPAPFNSLDAGIVDWA